MSFINRAEVSAAGVLGDSVALPVESAGVLGGINYVSAASGTLSATGNDPAGPDDGAYVDAFRFNAQGQMFIWNFDSRGLPPGGVFYTGGLPFTKDGQLVVTAQPVAWYVGGWPLALNNYVVGVPTGGGSLPGAFTFNVLPIGELMPVSWTASTGASVYELRQDGVLVATVNAPATSTNIPKPTLGGNISYTMAAINGTGTTQSSSNPLVILVQTKPATMAAPVATAGNATASIAFVPPADGGAAITQYQIQAFIGAAAGAVQTTAGPSPYVFTGLTNGTAYSFKIACSNSVGQSTYSPNSNVVTPTSTAAVAIFTAPLITTLIPSLATGSPTPTFTRASVTFVPNNGGDLVSIQAGEAALWGSRRVRNFITDSESPFTGSSVNGIAQTNGVTDPLGGNTAATLTSIATPGSFQITGSTPGSWPLCASAWIRRRTGVGTVTLEGNFNGIVDITPQLTGTWKRFAAYAAVAGSANFKITIATTGDAIDIAFIQLETLSPNIIQQPSEYVRYLPTDTAPYFGANVPGVKCFATVNGNTTGAAGVVTEAVGAPIPAATMKGILLEGQRTNLVEFSYFWTQAQWVKTNLTAVANGSTSPIGSSEGGTFTATAANGTILQTINTTAGQPYAFTIYLKRLTGTGVIEITTDGTTWTPVTGQINSTTWARVALQVASAAASLTVGVRIATSGDALVAWNAQLEQGTFPSSAIQSFSATSRVSDVLTYSAPSNILAATGGVSADIVSGTPATELVTRGIVTFPSIGNRPLYAASATGRLGIQDATGNGNEAFTAAAFVQNVPFKAASRWDAPGTTKGVILNAGAIVNAVSSGMTLGASFYVGTYDFGTSNAIFGGIKNLNIYSTPLSDAEMVAKTT